jgi:hypothetical protein
MILQSDNRRPRAGQARRGATKVSNYEVPVRFASHYYLIRRVNDLSSLFTSVNVPLSM